MNVLISICYDGPCVIDGWDLFVSQRRTGQVPAPQKPGALPGLARRWARGTNQTHLSAGLGSR